ncbi:MFS transporter [Amycolatopsis thermophila]|uniref:MFS family arabinose efflux permease n=1 Tax=Amycolatopsis thermophila TaxID=206084 RepID=A0ABU0ENX1_9PSEU|nr:MFS transporter [Amycolatopsis thermophila]MDQ0376992.1 putative MFS family arabinose efflux permease [Amycolatopsis thermophila]
MSLLSLGTFAVGTDAFVVAGFLPRMSVELDVSLATAGQSLTLFAVAYAVLSPVLASVTATVPRRLLLVVALAVLAIANAGSALAPTFAVLIVSRVVAAAGAATVTPNAGAVASALVPPGFRGRALAIVVGGLTVATAVGVPLGNLASRAMGWRTALALVAVLCLVVAIGLGLLLPKLDGGPNLPLRARLSVLRDPAVRAILPVTVLGMAAAYTAYAYAVPAFEAVGVPAGDSQWMLFLYGVGAVAGAQSAGHLTDRFGGVRVLTWGYATMTATLLVLGMLAHWHVVVPVLVAVLSLAWGASSWCQTPPQQHRLIGAAPESTALVIALNSSSIYAGIGAGTLIGGLAGATHPSWLFFSGAVIAVLAGVFLIRTSRRPAAQ